MCSGRCKVNGMVAVRMALLKVAGCMQPNFSASHGILLEPGRYAVRGLLQAKLALAHADAQSGRRLACACPTGLLAVLACPPCCRTSVADPAGSTAVRMRCCIGTFSMQDGPWQLTFSNLLAFLSLARTRASADRCFRPETTSRVTGVTVCMQKHQYVSESVCE